jgi:hypothetical protein
MEKLDYNPCDICNKGTTGRCDLMVHTETMLSWEDLAYCPIVRRMRPNEVLTNSKTGETYDSL